MLTEETAKLLIEAMNRLSGTIDRVTGMGSLGGGVHVYHHSYPTPNVYPLQQPCVPYWNGFNTADAQGQ